MGFPMHQHYDSQQACSWGCPWPAPKAGTLQGAALRQNISMNVNREEEEKMFELSNSLSALPSTTWFRCAAIWYAVLYVYVSYV